MSEQLKMVQEYCDATLSGMKDLGVWPAREQRGTIVHTESDDREQIKSIIDDTRRYVAFSGDIKAGKSTLVNRLLFPESERSILPVDPTPETAKITKISSIDESQPEYFEVSFYDGVEWESVLDHYGKSMVANKFRAHLDFSESKGACEREWIGHENIKVQDFSRLAEYVSANDSTKRGTPNIVRGKFVPFVKDVHIFCHSKWLSPDIVIVDTPGLADPNPINSDATRKWFPQAAFIVYVHSVEQAANLGRNEKNFLRQYLCDIDMKKFALVANFFDARLHARLDDDEWSDEKINNEAEFLIDRLTQEVKGCLRENIFPFSAAKSAEDARLDPKGLKARLIEILRQRVGVGESFNRAASLLMKVVNLKYEDCKINKAEKEDLLDKMRKDIKELRQKLDSRTGKQKEWEKEVGKFESDRLENIELKLSVAEIDIGNLKRRIEDNIAMQLDDFKRAAALAKSLRRIVSSTVDSQIKEFNRRFYEMLTADRNAIAGEDFQRKLVDLFNIYIDPEEDQFKKHMVEHCKVNFERLHVDLLSADRQEEWNQLVDRVDSLFSFYQTDLQVARDGVVRILHDYVFGNNDSILKKHYVKPYEDIRDYVAAQIKVLKDAYGRSKVNLERAVSAKMQNAQSDYTEESLTMDVSDLGQQILKLENFMVDRCQERDRLKLWIHR